MASLIELVDRINRGEMIEPEQLEVYQDSSNSAGVVIDAVRCCKVAQERGVSGPLIGPSAYYMKTPPRQLRDSVAREACNALIDGVPYELPESSLGDKNARG